MWRRPVRIVREAVVSYPIFNDNLEDITVNPQLSLFILVLGLVLKQWEEI